MVLLVFVEELADGSSLGEGGEGGSDERGCAEGVEELRDTFRVELDAPDLGVLGLRLLRRPEALPHLFSAGREEPRVLVSRPGRPEVWRLGRRGEH